MVTLARVVKPHGLQGGMKIILLCDELDYFKEGSIVWLKGEQKEILSFSKLNDGGIVILNGIEGIDKAEEYRNEYLELPEENLNKLPEGRFYNYQLVGMKAFSQKGEEIGTVMDAKSMPASDVLDVKLINGKNFLFPMNKSVILKIDNEKKEIIIDKEQFKDMLD